MNATPQPTTPSAAMIRTLGIVATVCGILIVSAYQGTLEAVAANKKIALERAVFKVIPGASEVREYVATPAGIAPVGATLPEGAVKFYAAYDPAGALKGIAAEGAANGYADTVRVMFAYDPAKQAITGLGVVSMRETPGIGDKIYTDAAFLKNFEALDVALTADMKQLAHAIKVVKHGSKQNPWEIDAIAGATVTSKAVGRGILDAAQKLLPLLAACRTLGSDSENRPRRDQFSTISPGNIRNIAQEMGEKWAGAVGLQPETPKSDRLLVPQVDKLTSPPPPGEREQRPHSAKEQP